MDTVEYKAVVGFFRFIGFPVDNCLGREHLSIVCGILYSAWLLYFQHIGGANF